VCGLVLDAAGDGGARPVLGGRAPAARPARSALGRRHRPVAAPQAEAALPLSQVAMPLAWSCNGQIVMLRFDVNESHVDIEMTHKLI
jgi:hypothetical protein